MAATTKKAAQEKTATFEIITPREFGRELAAWHKARVTCSDGVDKLLKSACVNAIKSGSTTNNLNKLLKLFGEDKRSQKDVTAMHQWIKENAVKPVDNGQDEPYFKMNSEGFYEVIEGMKNPKIDTNQDLMIRLFSKHWQECRVVSKAKMKVLDLAKDALQVIDKANKALSLTSEELAKKNIAEVQAERDLRLDLIAAVTRYAQQSPENAKKLMEIEEYMKFEGEKLNG